jgi:uncharacterized protein (DUF2336 family)
MPDQVTLVPDLEEALRHISVDRYAETVRRVADFFLAGANRFSEEQVHLFDRVLGRMIVAIETKALAELARRLAPVRNAPPDIIGRLARDPDIAVAAPVLARSTRLGDDDLIAVARISGQAHLLAISGRSALGESVTDVLVECGDRDIVRNVAMNHGARFSPSGLSALVERACHDAILAGKLAMRSDVPLHVLRQLPYTVKDEPRQRPLAAARPETQAGMQHILVGAPHNADAAADAETQRCVRALHRAGKLDEAKLLDFASSGRVTETIVALALLCNISIEVARRLLSGDQPDAALILCQAAGYSWPTACAVFEACNGGRTSKLDHACADLDRLTTPTAESIVGFWRACGEGLGKAA